MQLLLEWFLNKLQLFISNSKKCRHETIYLAHVDKYLFSVLAYPAYYLFKENTMKNWQANV